MTERKVGRVVSWLNLSSNLAIFRIVPDNGGRFPEYRAGQYIALGRDDCRLTRKIAIDGRIHTLPDLDEGGRQILGAVTHSYSIASAPFETQAGSYLEFYLVLERDGEGHPGRLTESLFRMNLEQDSRIHYLDRVQGDFTLEKRIAGNRNVLLVGTGTGLAPFVSMIKQQNHEAAEGRGSGIRYTLIHVSRTREELGYLDEFRKIEESGNLDLLYIPAVSRPTHQDRECEGLGVGRANNLVRSIFNMSLKEEDELQRMIVEGGDETAAEERLAKAVRPQLPKRIDIETLRRRLNLEELVILSCGNPNSLADIERVAKSNRIRFEKEEW